MFSKLVLLDWFSRGDKPLKPFYDCLKIISQRWLKKYVMRYPPESCRYSLQDVWVDRNAQRTYLFWPSVFRHETKDFLPPSLPMVRS